VPQGLTIVAAIRPGDEERLRGALRPLGDDIRGRRLADPSQPPRIDFSRMRGCHFARFAILDDPDRGPDCRRLLYSSNYDGDLEDHIAELAAATPDIDAIWGCCEAYTNRARFGEFLRAQRVLPEAFYIAFRGQTVAQVRQMVALRRAADSVLAQGAGAAASARSLEPPPGGARNPAPTAIAGRVVREAPGRGAAARVARALPIAIDVLRATVRCGFSNVVLGARRITAGLDRYTLLRWFNRLTRNRAPSTEPIYSSADLDSCAAPVPIVPGDEFPLAQHRLPPGFREDVVAQNQLTVVTVVRPGLENRVRAVMSAIDSYARRLAPDGSLLGVSTIHFVRWVLLDDGRRLMMLSDYDGAWEAYIDEFAEMILSGLDAIWDTSFGYPPQGARDLPAFKQFLRNHQVPSEVFYSAYPDETVLNIRNDRTFSASLDNPRAGGPAQ
jgi:hypothetical protein